MINYLKIENGQFVPSRFDTKDTIWLAVEKPTDEEIDQLVTTYKLPKDYITGVLDDDENSRFEGLHQNVLEEPALMLVQYPHATVSPSGYMQLDTFPFAIILTTDGKVITVINNSADFLKKALGTPFPDIELPIQETLILYLSWHISTCYNRFLKELIKETNKLEGELKVSTENSQLYQIMDIQKSLVYFESAINSNLEVLNMLYSAKIFKDPRAHLPRLHDILVETKQAATTTKIQLKLVDKISDTFSAIVSNNLNNVMKILTSLTIVLTIPTIIGGIFGMNVKLPFANREDAFFWIFVVTTGTCIFVIHRLKKRNLL
ncbi:cation transporter [Enterococcus moraviensis ATCC BAA-383]|uniref:Cation transporter n=1 Tax=Enterococcus moraviensis ATCC BAA-383 TaxID=1158609 RepID=R2TCV2_9ENTE|nr:magnesium transporter CorA family protein [Enterococcus moraviensis]EOI05158.1 cation transporter [Enterococcus moraviensis ATCC BAA-383]EOT63941.1 cation transporter [Enterococcus moraviensis ATCC BAA-383]OJG65699.1 cation transporter [Enterococcus moraviensis]